MIILAAGIAAAAGIGGSAIGAYGAQAGRSSSRPDFWSGLINRIRAQDLEGSKALTGGMAEFLKERPDLFSISPGASPYQQAIMQYAMSQGLDPNQWFGNATGFAQQNQLGRMGYMADQSQSYMADMDRYIQGQRGSLQGYGAQAGQNYLNSIVAPQVQQQMMLSGLGRSGAATAALAKAGAGIALPLAQQELGIQGQLANTGSSIRGAYGQQAVGNQQALQQDFANQMMQLFMAQPGVDTGLREAQLSRLNTGYNAADIDRQLALQQYQTRLGAYSSMLNNAPYTPGGTQSSSSTSFNGGSFGNLGQAASGAAGNLAGLYYLHNQQNQQRQQQAASNTDPYPVLYN